MRLTIMVILCCTLEGSLFANLSASSMSMVEDFAPVQLNSNWVYSYYFQSSIMNTYYTDSILYNITVTKIYPSGADTLVCLLVNGTGRHFVRDIFDSTKNTNSPISTSYTDTAIFRVDSIFKGLNYRCFVFPFWKSHAINSDSLSTGALYSGAVNYYQYSFYSSGGMGYSTNIRDIFIQGIGLYYHYDHETHLSGGSGKEISLLSYNNNNIMLGVRNDPPKLSPQKTTHAKLVLSNKCGQQINGQAFLINGRKLSWSNGVSNKPIVKVVLLKRNN